MLTSIPLYEHITIYQFTCYRQVSSFWLLHIKWLWKFMCMFSWKFASTSFGKGMTRWNNGYLIIILRNCQILFKVIVPFTFLGTVDESSIASNPQQLMWSDVSILDILIGIPWYFMIDLIFTILMPKNVSVIYNSKLKCLFILCLFKILLFVF